MKASEFVAKLREHDGERPVKRPLKYDGYTLEFANGDIYRYEETLKPGAYPKRNGYDSDDFVYSCIWNGEPIE